MKQLSAIYRAPLSTAQENDNSYASLQIQFALWFLSLQPAEKKLILLCCVLMQPDDIREDCHNSLVLIRNRITVYDDLSQGLARILSSLLPTKHLRRKEIKQYIIVFQNFANRCVDAQLHITREFEYDTPVISMGYEYNFPLAA